MRRVKAPCPSVPERSPGGQFAHLGNARFKRQHGLEFKSLAAVRVEASVEIDSRADDIERLLRGFGKIVDSVARGDVDSAELDALRLKRGEKSFKRGPVVPAGPHQLSFLPSLAIRSAGIPRLFQMVHAS